MGHGTLNTERLQLPDRDGGDPRLAIPLGVLFASGPIAIGVSGLRPPGLGLPLLVQVVLTAVLGLMLVREFLRGVPSLIRTFSLVFCYVSFGIGGTYQLANGLTPWFKQVSPESYLMAQLVMVVGFGSYWIVSGSERGSRGYPTRVVSTRRVGYLLVAYVALLPVLIPRVGGVDALFAASRRSAGQLVVGASEAERNLAVAPFRLVPVVILAALLLARRSTTNAKPHWAFVAIAAVLTVIANWPSTIPRFWLATIILMLLVVAIPLGRTGRITLASSATAVGLFAFPLLAWFRTDRGYAVATGVDAWATGDYDTLYTSALAVEWVQRLGHTLGEQTAGALLFFIPRSLWSNKPIDTGVMVASDSGFSFTNLSSPLWAEGYVDLGLVGAALAGGLFGLGVRHLTRRTDDAAALIIAFLVGYQLILLRGALLQAMGELVLAVGLAALVTRRSPTALNAHRARPLSARSSRAASDRRDRRTAGTPHAGTGGRPASPRVGEPGERAHPLLPTPP